MGSALLDLAYALDMDWVADSLADHTVMFVAWSAIVAIAAFSLGRVVGKSEATKPADGSTKVRQPSARKLKKQQVKMLRDVCKVASPRRKAILSEALHSGTVTLFTYDPDADYLAIHGLLTTPSFGFATMGTQFSLNPNVYDELKRHEAELVGIMDENKRHEILRGE